MGETSAELGVNTVSSAEEEERYLTETYQQEYLQRLLDTHDGVLTAEQIKKYKQLAGELAREKRGDEKKYKYDRLMDKLLSRPAFEDEIEKTSHLRERHPGQQGAVIFIDVNNLKQTNDTKGHKVGDEGLKIVNDSVREAIRATDTAGRYGGDEVVILLNDANIKEAAEIAVRLKKAQETNAQTFKEKTGANMSLSIGISPLRDGVSVKQSIEEADQAMYTSKLQLNKDAIVISGMDNQKEIEETHAYLTQKNLNIPIVGTPLANPASPLSKT